ncbi:hypothetical protein [Humibacter ginsenosidimutans]|uniref:Uncharacterized protein n=1 Tax=Humibacter ginsenosidimutans TaxID=2599293 RepID=A0A5B8M2R0_9MICO|nr:hypothetical protein [Humibacter ginsenosidimutans]QDZ14229.1 hypothetical protein FPZ11_05120 [Humibacter ginsenosidimutans]
MFGRRRHAAQAAPIVAVAEVAAPLPRLAEEQIFELVHSRVAAAIGESGEWVVRRRTDGDTDELFRAVLAHQVALEVTAALRDAQLKLDAGEEPAAQPALAAPPLPSPAPVNDDAPVAEPAVVEAEPVVTTPVLASVEGDEADASGRSTEAVTTQPLEMTDHAPSHRHDEPEGDDEAVLDEDSLALQWEPAPITTWTDLKWPVTEPLATIVARQAVAQNS